MGEAEEGDVVAGAEDLGLEGLEGLDPEEIAALEAQLAVGEEDVAAEGAVDGEEAGVEEAAVEEAAPLEEPGDELDGGLDEEVFEDVDVEDHLRDAVEGNLRLKRMLSSDGADEQSEAKRRKLDPEHEERWAKATEIATKWGLVNDALVMHVLVSCEAETLDTIASSPYMPDRSNLWKSPGEMLSRHVADLGDRKMPGGSGCDAVSAFKFRWKIDLSLDKQLRALSHKELRYVLTNYDGSRELSEFIAEAAAAEVEEELATSAACPSAPGVSTVGRFTRLELIDPLADAAVFGDANLTFALKLAAHRTALGHVGRVVATTFEELPTLRERYKEIDQSIKMLEEQYAEVYHGVDCTRIAIDPRFKAMQGALGAVYYNFPHSGAIQGFFDGHPVVNWRHENLMRLFFRALRHFMKPGGYVKVSSNMGAVGVRYAYIVGSAMENEFLHIETVPFLEWHLHRYGRSYGDKRDIYKRPDAKNNQSYNAQAADRDMVYCFCYAPSGDPIGKQNIKLPPTLKVLRSCTDGPFKNMPAVGKESLAQQLHKRFVTEISGTHVG